VTFEINRAKGVFEIGSWITLPDLLGEHCATVMGWLRWRCFCPVEAAVPKGPTRSLTRFFNQGVVFNNS